ncbi:MAG: alpha/beta hydrolase [Desulfobulbaceae bacterium]|nr:alpha/beta hydrolase [Desulfobulbaceae bacterium]
MPHLKINESHRLHYQLIHGVTAMPYLVFLHEGLGCAAMWGDFPELLCRATGCPGLVYDRLGYGESSPLNHPRTVHYLHEYALHELPMLLERIIPRTPFILIGHSDGGSISLIYGAERPALLKGIITEAAHVFVDPKTIAGIKSAQKAWAKGKLSGLAKYHGDKTETIFKAWAETWLSQWFKHWNIEYLLPSLEVPILAIQGGNDQYGSTEQVKSIASKTSGYTQMKMLENCSHVPHIEAQPVVVDLMTDFIARLSQGL